MRQKKNTYKLLQKTSQEFLLLSGISFGVTAIALFAYTQHLLRDEYEEELESQATFVTTAIAEGDLDIGPEPLIEVESTVTEIPRIVKDTLIYDPGQGEIELFRQLTKSTRVDGKLYRITVRTLVIESEDIIGAIVVSFLSILTVVFFILFFVNKSRNKRLWEPFFNSLHQLKTFRLDADQSLTFSKSKIEEFQELNQELTEITDKLRADYRNLKQFTADISHETQTPLAIIQAKVDNIINQNGITEAQYEAFTAVQKEIKRLSQLNSNLIVLTKIDNHQFPDKKQLDLKALVIEKIEHFSNLTPAEFKLNAKTTSKVSMSPYLADMLLNNLFSNAIKYGNGKPVYIEIRDRILIMSNFGEAPIAEPTKVFDRFYKEGKHPKSTGLGLYIVKKICDHYGFLLLYKFSTDQHIFELQFKPSSL